MSISSTLYGHGEEKTRLLALKQAGRLPHALLISGPKGVGKATFCHHIALALLGGGSGAWTRMHSGAHADFLVLSPAVDEKTGERKREISVEQAREIPKFLSLTPAESPMRVVVVDSADELNTNAANALLKNLEEPPPNTLLMLVSHQPSTLLPTIRSRCQKLHLHAPNPSEFREILLEIAPEIGGEDVELLGALTAYAPGLAMHYHQHDALAMYAQWKTLLETQDMQALQSFAASINGKQRHTQFELAKAMLLTLLSRLAKGVEQVDNPAPRSAYAAQWMEANHYFTTAAEAYLDYTSALLAYAPMLKSA